MQQATFPTASVVRATLKTRETTKIELAAKALNLALTVKG
jgi:hypothetical protein